MSNPKISVNPPTPYVRVQGAIEEAVYTPSSVQGHAGNPIIEALPPIYETQEALVDKLQLFPPFPPEIRQLPNLIRVHELQIITDFYVPLTLGYEFAYSLDIALRSGYVPRNPFEHYFHKVSEKLDKFSNSYSQPLLGSTRSISVVGVSGTGKTASVNRGLSLYSQVINHTEYKGEVFLQKQIVWLKLDCPRNGSTKGLCTAFFQAVDRLLGTNYFRHAAKNGNARVDAMVSQMATVVANQCLGVLVIDEIQNLHGAKEGTVT